MTGHPYISTEDAIKLMRADPRYAALIRDTFLDVDASAASARFEASGEWTAVRALLGPAIAGAVAVDLGAGNGIASRALAHAGAARVVAIEPDPSNEIGRGAITRVCSGLPVEIVAAWGELLPLPDGSVDIVFARQVLHHTRDLAQTLRECARILRSGGSFLACREHVANTPEELAVFLAGHPVHQLTGGENAYSLDEYRAAIEGTGMRIEREIGPWDSVINLSPAVVADSEIAELPQRLLRERLGRFGSLLSRLPGVIALVGRHLRRPRPGRLYSFLAIKP